MIDNAGKPILSGYSGPYECVICCDTLPSVIDSILAYIPYLDSLNRKVGQILDSPLRDWSDIHTWYFDLEGEDYLEVAPTYTVIELDGDRKALRIDSAYLVLSSDSTDTDIYFKTKKTAGAFADSLKNAWRNCCM